MSEDISAPADLTSGGNETPDQVEKSGSFIQKIVVSVIIGLLAVSLIFVYSLYKSKVSALNEESQLRESAELRADNQEGELLTRKREIDTLQARLSATEKVRDEAVSELTGLKTENVRLVTKLESSETRAEELSARLASEEAALAELRLKFDEERAGQKLLFGKIEKLMEEREELRAKLATGSSVTAVELPPMVVRDQAGPQSSVVGEVLAVNERYGFIVVNLGKFEGVASGARFKILDHGMVVGEAEARRVMDRMTVADLVNGQSSRRIRKNFKVVLYK